MWLFDPYLYEKVHNIIVLVISFLFFFYLWNKSADKILQRKRSFTFPLIYALVFIVVVGMRPVSNAFMDTVNYAHTYESYSGIEERIVASRDSLFYLFMWLCSQVMSVNAFFLILEFLYVFPIVLACNKLLKNNTDIGIIFCFAAFSFFSYGVNGLRNGIATSFMLLAISLLRGDGKEKIACLILTLLAIGIHASSALPAVCMIAAYLIKNRRIMFTFWMLSIIISLFWGGWVESLFASIGFDDRLSDYIHPEFEEGKYTDTSFRWDFLLYSALPVLLGYYVVIKKKVFNPTYLLLLGTYIYANAFWIMIIRAEFSNRFAYLSWFLYPMVLVYPLVKLKIWPKTQGRKTAVIMAAHLAFTLIMVFLL